MTVDRGLVSTIIFAAILALAVGGISLALSKGSISLSAGLGAAIFLTVLFLYIMFTSAGDVFSSAMFGMGRDVDSESLRAEGYEEMAEKNFQDENYEKALDYYLRYLVNEKNKSPERTAFRIAQIYQDKLNDFKEATYYYRKSIALSSKKENLSSNSYAQESQKAIDQLANLAQRTAKPVKEILVEAKKLIENGNYDEASEMLDDLEKTYPKNAEVDYLRAHYFLYQNNMGMGIEFFKRCLEKEPGHTLAAFFLASTLHEFGHLLEARDLYRKYFEIAKAIPAEKSRLAVARKKLEKLNLDLENPLLDSPGSA